VVTDGTSILGTAPGFVNAAADDYHLAAGSSCIDAAGSLAAACSPNYLLTRQLVQYKSSIARPIVGSALDIGAFEFGNP